MVSKNLFKLLINIPTIAWLLLRWFARAWAEERVLPILQSISAWVGIPMLVLEGFLAGVLFISSIVWVYSSVRKSRKVLSPVETIQEIKNREKYLPDIKKYIAEITNRMEYLANSDDRLYNLDEYRKEYPIVGWHFKRIAEVNEPTALEGYLWAKKVFYDSLVFRRVQSEDTLLTDITSRLDNLYTEVLDRRVKRYIKNIRKALHHAYSYVIFNKLSTMHFKTIPLKAKLEYEHGRKMMDRVRDLQDGLNARIKELLEGASDER